MGSEKRVIRKRRFPRRKFLQKVGILFKGQYALSETVQIGEGGMMLKSPHAHKEGDIMVVSFMVPGRAFVIVKSQVQYGVKDQAGKPMYGLKFLNISFENRRLLRDFISAKTEEEARAEGVYY